MEKNSIRARTSPSGMKMEVEMLQAECQILRMQKEETVKMWEQDSREMETTILVAHSLRSALHTLLKAQGRRRKIIDEKMVNVIMEGTLHVGIQSFQERLEKLRSNSEMRERELKSGEEGRSCCPNKSCVAAIRNVIEQLEAESRQLSELLQLLPIFDKQVQELRKSRDLWQSTALCAIRHVAALNESMYEWRHKALSSQSELWHLQSEIDHLRKQTQRNTVLYHEKIASNEPVQREKIDNPFENGVTSVRSRSELGKSHTNGPRLCSPRRKPPFHKERNLPLVGNGCCERSLNSEHADSKTNKNNGVMISQENLRVDKTRHNVPGRNQRSAGILYDMSNIKFE